MKEGCVVKIKNKTYKTDKGLKNFLINNISLYKDILLNKENVEKFNTYIEKLKQEEENKDIQYKLNFAEEEEKKEERKNKIEQEIEKELNNNIDELDIDFSPLTENDNYNNEIEEDYNYIKGLSTTIQRDVLNKIVNEILENMQKGKLVDISQEVSDFYTILEKGIKVNIENSSISEELKKSILEQITILSNNKVIIYKKVRKHLLKNISVTQANNTDKNKYLEERKKALAEMNLDTDLTDTDEIEDDDLEEDNDTGEDKENNDNWGDNSLYKTDGRQSLSQVVKTLFVNISKGRIINGQYKTWTNGITETTVPFDEAYNKVVSLLANNNGKDYIYPSYEDMINELKKHTTNTPFLHFLIEKLEKSDTGVKNAFVTDMSKQYSNYTFMSITRKGDILLYNKSQSDNRSKVDLVLNEWYSNLTNRETTSISTGEDGKARLFFNDKTLEQINLIINKTNKTIEDLKLFNNNKRKHGLDTSIDENNQIINTLLDEEGKIIRNKNIVALQRKENIKTLKDYEQKLRKNIMSNIDLVLRVQGIKLPSELIDFIIINGGINFNYQVNVEEVLKEQDSLNNSRNSYGYENIETLANTLIGQLETLLKDKSQNFETKNPIDNKFIKTLAKYTAYFRTDLYSTSFRNISNDSVYSYNSPKNIIDNILKIKSDKNYLNNLKDDDYLRSIQDLNNPYEWLQAGGDIVRFRDGISDNLVYSTVDGLSEIGKRKPVDKMNESEYLYYIYNTFFASSNSDFAYVMFPTMSDKSVPLDLKVPKVNYSIKPFDKKNSSNNKHIEQLFDALVLPELKRMSNAKDKKTNIEEFEKGKNQIFLFPELNTVSVLNENDEEVKVINESFITNDKGEVEYIAEFNPEALSEGSLLHNALLEKFHKIIVAKIKQQGNQLINLGLAENIDGVYQYTSKLASNKNLGNIYSDISTFAITNIVANAQIQKIFIGDPALFYKEPSGLKDLVKEYKEKKEAYDKFEALSDKAKKGILKETQQKIQLDYYNVKDNFYTAKYIGVAEATSDNQGKRLAGDNASGKPIIENIKGEKFKLWIVKSSKVASAYIKQYKEKLGDNASNYESIDSTDAQEFTTIYEYLDILVRMNTITEDIKNKALEAYDNDEEIDFKALGIVIQAHKPVYNNNFLRDGVNSRLYVKSASLPLIKQFTKGLPIDKVRELMEKNKIQRLAFTSAVKVGTPTNVHTLVNKEGMIELPSTDENGILKDNSLVLDVPRLGHKTQQDIPYDEKKRNINDGTQQRQLLFEGILNMNGFIDPETGKFIKGRELYNKYINKYDKAFLYKYNKFLKEFTTNEGKYINYSELIKVLRKEAIKMNWTDNEVAELKLGADGRFEVPLYLAKNEGKMISLINSLVDNNIRKLKPRGKSYVLVSEVGINISKTNKNIVTIEGFDGELKPMRTDEKTGEILPAEVIIPFNMFDNYGTKLELKNFVDNNGNLDTTKLPPELLESFGFRIPTQGHSSMTYVKVVGFTTAGVNYGDIMFAPKDLVAQMGSDFDADKMYNNFYNTLYDNNTGILYKATQELVDKIKKQNEDSNTSIKSIKENYSKINQNKEKRKELVEKFLEGQDDLFKETVRTILTFKTEIAIDNYLNDNFEGLPNDIINSIKDIKREVDSLKININELYKENNTKEKIPYIKLPKEIELQVLENDILDIHKSVMLHPEVDKKMKNPLDNKELNNITELAKEFNSKKSKSNYTPLSAYHQSSKYLNARSGKTGVSSFALDNVLNATLQTVEKPMFIYEEIEVPNNEGKKTRKIKTYKIAGKETNALNNPLTMNGGNKSDLISAFLSVAVDNEKLQLMDKINVNKTTFDFIRGAIQQGLDENLILTILNNPFIKYYISQKQLRNNAEINKLENLIDKFNKDTTTSYSGSLKDEKILDKLKFDIELNIKDYIDKEGILEKDKDTLTSEDRIIGQRIKEIFKLYNDLEGDGKQLRVVQSALNSDSSGIGKDMFYSLEKQRQIELLRGMSTIPDAHLLVGNYISTNEILEDIENYIKHLKDNPEEEYKSTIFNKIPDIKELVDTKGVENLKTFTEDFVIEINSILKELGYINTKSFDISDKGLFIKPNTIKGFTSVYAVMTNNKIWKDLFPYENSFFNSALNPIVDIIEKNTAGDIFLEQSIKNKRKVFNSLKSFLSSSFTVDNNMDINLLREKLLVKETFNEFGEPEINESLMKVLIKVKELTAFKKNAFIQRLDLGDSNVFKKGETIDNVRYNASQTDSIDEESVTEGFIDLLINNELIGINYLGKDLTGKDLANILINHQMITGGVQKANQFIKHIPTFYLKQLDYYNQLDSFRKEFSNFEIGIIISNFLQRFKIQYFQHNPKEAYNSFIEKVINEGVKDPESDTIFEVTGVEDKVLVNNTNIQFPDIFSVRHPNSKGYVLYVLNEDGTYHAVDNLGERDVLEYNLHTDKQFSMIPDNRFFNEYNNRTSVEVINPITLETLNSLIEKELIIKICK